MKRNLRKQQREAAKGSKEKKAIDSRSKHRFVKTEKKQAQKEAALYSYKDKWPQHAYLWPGKK